MIRQDNKYDALKLDHQICFPLYAASKEIVKRYKPFLDEIGLTYTQYITMLVLWEKEKIGAKELGEKLYLDSGTLTPVLKSLEQKGLVTRTRPACDERTLVAQLTEKGRKLKDQAVSIPAKMVSSCVALSAEEAAQLYVILYKILGVEKR